MTIAAVTEPGNFVVNLADMNMERSMNQTLFDLAYALNEGRANYDGSGVPAELMVAISSATGLDDSDAIAVARIVLLAMTTQRAVDQRLSGGDGAANPGDEFDDCLAPD